MLVRFFALLDPPPAQLGPRPTPLASLLALLLLAPRLPLASLSRRLLPYRPRPILVLHRHVEPMLLQPSAMLSVPDSLFPQQLRRMLPCLMTRLDIRGRLGVY